MPEHDHILDLISFHTQGRAAAFTQLAMTPLIARISRLDWCTPGMSDPRITRAQARRAIGVVWVTS
jgi:hypothetical protein